jgi:hypothetical protein
MQDRTPESGDLLIRSGGSDAIGAYTISTVPGPDQFGCAMRGEMERLGRFCARRGRVDLWLSDGRRTFTLLARFREPARQLALDAATSGGRVYATNRRDPRRLPTVQA